MFKKNILITGGAGFVGTNLIKLILEKTNYRVISLDDYSSGSKKNHLKDRRVKYINAHTKNISQTIEDPKSIQTVFHFGEFARIYQSFLKMDECVESNAIGSNAVFNFCQLKSLYISGSGFIGDFPKPAVFLIKGSYTVFQKLFGHIKVL